MQKRSTSLARSRKRYALSVLCRASVRLSDVAVIDPEPRMGDRKVRVDRDRTLEQRQGRGGAALNSKLRDAVL